MMPRSSVLAARAVVVVAVAAALAGGACPCFVTDLPGNAQVRCAPDGTCPAGRACNAVDICVVGDDVIAPVIERVRFEPAATRDTAQLIIEVSEPLRAPPNAEFAAAGAPRIEEPAPAPPPETLVFTFEVRTDGVADGIYALDAVGAVDVAGNDAFVAANDATLTVDRDPPQLSDVVVLPSGRVSDVFPNNRVTVSFTTSEPAPLLPVVAVGNTSAPCALTDAAASQLAYTCAVDLVPGDVVEGDGNTVRIHVEDAAGNAAVETRALDADVALPSLVSAFAVVRDPAGEQSDDVGYPGGAVAITLFFDEPVVEAPALTLVPAGRALPPAAGAGQTWTVTFDPLPGDIPAGPHTLVARFSDVAGHDVPAAPVPLAPPFAAGIAFAPTFLPPCVVPGQPCVDFDGDGFFADTNGCAVEADDVDCHDDDGAVFPGAPERPGNGKDDDCASGGNDLLILEEHGVFVDNVNPDATDDPAFNPGSMAVPFRSLRPAAQLALATSRSYVFMRGSAEPYAFDDVAPFEPELLSVSLVGGLVVNGNGVFVRPPVSPKEQFAQPTRIVAGDFSFIDAPLVDNIEWGDTGCCGVTLNARVVVDSKFAPATSFGGDNAVVSNTTVEGLATLFGSGAARVLDESTMGTVVIAQTTLFHRARTLDVSVVDPARELWATSSVFTNLAGLAAVNCDPCAGVHLFHSVAINQVNDALDPRAAVRARGGRLVAGGNIIVNPHGHGFRIGENTVVTLAHNDIDAPIPAQGSASFGLDTVNQCGVPACVGSEGNIDTLPLFLLGDPTQLSQSPANDPLIDVDIDAGLLGAPTSVASDFRGQCRYRDGLPDLGVDEL